MAQISLHVSTEFESEIEVSTVRTDGECMGIALNVNLSGVLGGRPVPYSRDWVTIHGSIADMRVLAQKMLAALPAEVVPEPAATAAELNQREVVTG